mmetsp:Transcript_52380/g.63128  ORF Transcript_52380/g.63128 Transcript_52380/m.63128 type:complete len:278 (-) Transcript_52380:159-992(-)
MHQSYCYDAHLHSVNGTLYVDNNDERNLNSDMDVAASSSLPFPFTCEFPSNVWFCGQELCGLATFHLYNDYTSNNQQQYNDQNGREDNVEDDDDEGKEEKETGGHHLDSAVTILVITSLVFIALGLFMHGVVVKRITILPDRSIANTSTRRRVTFEDNVNGGANNYAGFGPNQFLTEALLSDVEGMTNTSTSSDGEGQSQQHQQQQHPLNLENECDYYYSDESENDDDSGDNNIAMLLQHQPLESRLLSMADNNIGPQQFLYDNDGTSYPPTGGVSV